MGEKFKLAIVGAGGIANAHVAAAQDSESRIEVSAVVDPVGDARSRIEDSTGAASFESVEAMLADGHRPDGAIICTPPSVRIPIIKRLLEAGIPVLTEKPLTHRLTDSNELVELAGASDVPTGVAFCHRFTPAVNDMKRRIGADEIGTLSRIEITFACNHPGMRDHWMSEPEASGGGSFIDTGCHSLDLFQYLVGPPTMVGKADHHAWPERAGESSASALVVAPPAGGGSPVAGVLLTGWAECDRFTVRAVGTGGTLAYDFMKPTDLVLTGIDGTVQTHEVETHEVRFRDQLLAFAALARSGTREQLATFEEGARVMQVILGHHESGAIGGVS